MLKIMLSINRNSFNFFQFSWYLFSYSCFMPDWTQLGVLALCWVEIISYLSYSWSYERHFQSFTTEYVSWKHVTLHLTCEFLSLLDVEFVKCFLFIYWEEYVIFTFHSIKAVYHIDWSTHSCILRMNLTRSWCMILSMFCWILFASILLRV